MSKQRRPTDTDHFPGGPIGTTIGIGAACWAVAPVLFLAGQLVTERWWPRSYSWAVNNISDLGNVACQAFDGRDVCSPGHALFNTAAVMTGILLLVGIGMTWKAWSRGVLALLSRCCLLLASIGYVLVGLFPADMNLDAHVFAALLVMPVANLGIVLAGFIRGFPSIGRVRVLNLLVGAVALIASYLHVHGPWLGLGQGGMERVAVFALPAWAALLGIVLLAAQRRAGRQGGHPAASRMNTP